MRDEVAGHGREGEDYLSGVLSSFTLLRKGTGGRRSEIP